MRRLVVRYRQNIGLPASGSCAKRSALKEGLGKWNRWLVVAVLLLAGIALCLRWVPVEQENVRNHLRGFPDSDAWMHGWRPQVLAGLFLLPFVASLWYALSGILSRWLTREFLQALLICYGGILVVYFLIDFSGNAAKFSEGEGMTEGAWMYYSRMAPAIFSLLLPFGILFSVLFCVGKISRSREVVAALQSGRGMLRVMLPLYICGAFASLFYMGCNYHWGPMAEGMKDANRDEASGKTGILKNYAVYYYAKGRRMWMVKEIPRDYDKGMPLTGVEVTTLNKDGSLASRLYAKEARWQERDGSWSFTGVELSDHHKGKAPIFVSPPTPYVKTTWRETPAQIIEVGLDVRHLGLPDLSGMLKSDMSAEWLERDPARYGTQWHYRLALPLSCLIYVILAVPLALFVTRHASGGAIMVAILLAILSVLLGSFFLALGESDNMNPRAAAWAPTIAFALIGLWLMKRRSSGRPLWPLIG